MKKNQWNEGLNHLDPDLVEKYTEHKDRIRQKKKQKNIWLRFGAIAACFVLIIGVVLASPHIFYAPDLPDDTTTGSDDTDKELIPPQIGEIEFDSLDKVNFYGGLKVITDTAPSVSVKSSRITTASYLLITDKSSAEILKLSETSPTDDFESPSSEYGEKKNGTNVAWDLTGEQMTITTAVYFRINVTEADILLASRIGTGEAEVVVTDLHIGINPFAMITFKNGDKFFSCLSEMYGLQNGENHFGSHLYIKGFEMFKDTVDEMTSFYTLVLDKDNKTVSSFKWKSYNRRPSEAPIYAIEIIPETIHISYDTYVFTLDDLSSYWKNGYVVYPDNKVPEDPPESLPGDDTVEIQEGETMQKPPSPPEIYDDGMLRYYLVDGEYYEVSGIYNSGFADLVIPEDLFGYPIKGIQNNAFRNYKYLKSVVIPAGVEYIGDYAFYNCDNLTSVTMPKNAKIGYKAFGKDGEPDSSGTIPDISTTLPSEDTTENKPLDTTVQDSLWLITRSDGVELVLDRTEFEKLFSMCKALKGEYGGNSKGHYGALYTIRYTDSEGRTYIFSLWDENTYTCGFIAFVGQSSYIYPDFMKDTDVKNIIAILDGLYENAGY